MPPRLPGMCVLSSLLHHFFMTALSLSTLFAATEVLTFSQDARAARCLEPFGRRKSEQRGKIGQESLRTFHGECGECRECWDLRLLPFVAFPLSRSFFRSVGAKALSDHCDDRLKINEKKASWLSFHLSKKVIESRSELYRACRRRAMGCHGPSRVCRDGIFSESEINRR